MGWSRRALLVSGACLAALPRSVAAADAGLAVLYFENVSKNNELDALAVALSEMLIVEFSGHAPVRVVERAQLQKIFDELDLGHSGKVDPSTAADMGRLVGARWLLLGSYFEMFGSLSIQSRMVDVETGEILFATSVRGAAVEFLDMMGKLATAHLGDLRVRAAPPPPKPAAKPPAPAAPAPRPASAPAPAARSSAYAKGAAPPVRAALALSDGLVAMDRGDKGTALVALNEAVQLQPDMKAARTALAALAM